MTNATYCAECLHYTAQDAWASFGRCALRASLLALGLPSEDVARQVTHCASTQDSPLVWADSRCRQWESRT